MLKYELIHIYITIYINNKGLKQLCPKSQIQIENVERDADSMFQVGTELNSVGYFKALQVIIIDCQVHDSGKTSCYGRYSLNFLCQILQQQQAIFTGHMTLRLVGYSKGSMVLLERLQASKDHW